MTEADFEQPQPVSQLDMAFGGAGDTITKLLPPMELIPKEFHMRSGSKWARMQETWFFSGLDPKTLTEKPGVDKVLAIRHLQTIQGSFEPQHEHKVAAVAWLASRWFTDWEEK